MDWVTLSNFRLPVPHFPAVKKVMMPTGIKRIPAQAVIPGQAVADEDITKVRSVSTSEMALCDVNNEAEETTGSLHAEALKETTAIPINTTITPRMRRISIDESESAAVTAKPAKPNALNPGAAIWPETSSPMEFSVGKVTARINHVCDQPMSTEAESTKAENRE